MSVASLVSVEEYLATTWHPDCDFVDGILVERNVGQKDHSNIQRALLVWFWERRRTLRLKPFAEWRVKVSSSRYRIPDVSVVSVPEPTDQVLAEPPYICIEVISPDDTLRDMQDRFDDYINMGVPNVWAIDPATGRAWTITREGHIEATAGVLRTVDGKVVLPLTDLYEE